MPSIPGLRRVFRLDAPLRRVDGDVDEELAFHFEAKIAELRLRGLSPEAARAEAERRFGDVRRYRAELRTIDHERAAAGRRTDLREALMDDLRHAVRGLRRNPGFALAVVLTFAIGIGANATMFGLVDRLVLRTPPHVAAPEALYRLGMRYAWRGDTIETDAASYPLLRDFREQQAGRADAAFSTIAAYTGGELSLGRGADAVPVRALVVTGGFFRLTGTRPALGRLLQPSDDGFGVGEPAAVLGHGFWRRRFGGDRDVVGRTIQLDRGRYTIVGVAPEGFVGIAGRRAPEVFLPLVPVREAAGTTEALTEYGWQFLNIVGRLRPGATPEQAAAQLSAVYRAVGPRSDGGVDSTAVGDLRSVLPRADVGESADAKVALLLAGVSTLVLLIACANVANLLLARALRRRREIAVRLALGVSRGRLVAQLLTESVLLAALGGLAALLVVQAGGSLLRRLLFAEAAWEGSPVDGRVLAFTAAATLLTGLVAGLIPALQASRPSLTGALRLGAREGGGRQARTRAVLLVTQAALSVLLLVGTGLFVRSLQRVNAERLGMDVREVLVGTMRLRSLGYEPPRVDALFRDLEVRARSLPGVAQASVAASLPLASSYATGFRIAGRDSLPRVPDGGPYVNAVSGDFFSTLGVRILSGRGLTAADRAGTERVVVVNESMARLFWPDESPIGACVHIGADSLPCATVVGVAENARRQKIAEETSLQYLVPLGQEPGFMQDRMLFVRPAPGADAARVSAAVQRMMQGAAADLPYAEVFPMSELLEGEMRPWRMGASLFGAFGLLALVLAAVGLYGVIAHSVSQRTHELGVRMALGARAGDVRRMILWQGVALAATGAAIGLLAAAAAAPRLESLLFRTAPRDPVVFAGVALTLLTVAAAACLVPAWRASRVDPSVALRAD